MHSVLLNALNADTTSCVPPFCRMTGSAMPAPTKKKRLGKSVTASRSARASSSPAPAAPPPPAASRTLWRVCTAGKAVVDVVSCPLASTKCAALVLPTTREFNTSGSPTAAAVVAAAGDAVVRACNKYKVNSGRIPERGVAVTPAGALACQWLIHAPLDSLRQASAASKVWPTVQHLCVL